MPHERSPLLVFSDDWGRHPSSAQHLVRHLLGERRVLWVNTIGTRRPRLCLGDLRRGLEKLRQWSAPSPAAGHGAGNPVVLNPVMWPDFSSVTGRAVNPVLLGRSVARAVREHLGGEEPVVLTTVPLVASLVGRVPAKRWVYYCVDDWSTWPGLDHAALECAERRLLSGVDATAAVSGPLVERLEAAGHRPALITHGVDPQMWRGGSGGDDHPTVARLRRLRGPRAVFWGLIDTLLDAEAIRKLAAAFAGSVVLIGPEGNHAKQIAAIPGVTCLPAVPHAVLPAVARAADVLLMPYRPDYPSMKAAQPLKLMEYLATDRPVVCLDVESARRWADCCDVVGRAEFAACVVRRAGRGADAAQLRAREQKLRSESWAAKARVLESLLDDDGTAREHRKAG